MKYFFGVDIGGTNIRIGVMDENHQLIKIIKKSSKDIKSNEDLINKIVELYNEVSEYPCSALGIGVCGPCNVSEGYAYFIPNMNLVDVHFTDKLKEYINCPIYIGNDANVAGLCEALMGAGKGKSIVQYITISTGVGGGLFVNGHLVTGDYGFAQEIGHIKIKDSDEKLSSFTSAGSLESLCSGSALTRRANKMGVKASHAGEVFNCTDPVCKGLVEEFIQNFAEVLVNITYFIEPSIIVIGGGVAKSFAFFGEALNRRYNELIFPPLKDKIRIVKAEYDQDTGILGACLLGEYYLSKTIDK